MKIEDVQPGVIMYVWLTDDVTGGKATVVRVIDHPVNPMVVFKELPGMQYGLRPLLEQQEELEVRYGDQWAHHHGEYENSRREPANSHCKWLYCCGACGYKYPKDCEKYRTMRHFEETGKLII